MRPRTVHTALPCAPPNAGEVYLARQPILDAGSRVIGYELLFRGSATDQEFRGDPEQATARVISDVMSAFDIDVLTGGHLAFINVTRAMLVGGVPPALPPHRVVLELVEDIEADPDVIGACRSLKEGGYRLALDDFRPGAATSALLAFADFVKAERIPEDDAWIRAVRHGGTTSSVVAERIETFEDFARARQMGFTHFQGFFFGRPATQRASAIPESQLDYLRLIDALRDPNLSTPQMEALIKPHASLCYRVLRTVNSAGFGLRAEVGSIGDALLLLGREPIQRWVSIWALASLARGSHHELLVMSLTRARFCELLAAAGDGETNAAGGFLLGMCSMLDVIFGKPIGEVIEHLPLGAPLRAALAGEDNAWRRVLRCVTAYERADWPEASRIARQLALPAGLLGEAHADALTWSSEACRFGAADRAA